MSHTTQQAYFLDTEPRGIAESLQEGSSIRLITVKQ